VRRAALVLGLSVALLACGCSKRQATGAAAPGQATLAAAPRYPRLHLFPVGRDTLRVEVHYAHDDDTLPLASGATVSFGSGRPLNLEGDVETQDYWQCVDSLSGRDLNGDGTPEAVLVRGNGGSCESCRNLIIVSVVNGSPRVISPEPERGVAPRALKDLRHTGRYQLLMMDTSWEMAHGFSEADSPKPYRVRCWNGSAYVDSTAAYPDFLRAGMTANLAEARRLEAAEGASDEWLSHLVEYELYAQMLGQGKAELDTVRGHIGATPIADPGLRATVSEVEMTLIHQQIRRR
jgi:hypothetical protein